MNRTTWIVLAAAMGAMMISGIARADGMMIMDEATWRKMREHAMINEPEQKAVVFFSKGKEQLIISPSYGAREQLRLGSARAGKAESADYGRSHLP